jgi:outer membrane protein assembly complex protein YaeT
MWSNVNGDQKGRPLPRRHWRWLVSTFLLFLVMPVAAQVAPAAFTLREAGVTVSVTGIEAKAWDDLRDMLRDQLTLSGNSTATEPLADDLAFFTRQEYIRKGWPDAEVRWEVAGNVISLDIESRRQIRVGEITWRGSLILPEDELRSFLLRPSTEREGADNAHPVWVKKELDAGIGLVQRRLRAEGYLQALVQMTPAPEIQPDGLRNLTVEVTSGPRFTFGSVEFSGAPSELDARMRAQIAQTPGEPFNEARVQQIESQLTTMAKDRGWLNATTLSDYTLGKMGGTVDVILIMTAGERVTISRVVPHEDFSRGSRRVLTANFREAEGKFYQSEDLDIMFKRTLDTSMFARLDVEPRMLPGVSPAAAELRITGEETKPKTLGFELGFDTFLGAQAGVNYRNTNFRDWGNTLAAELNYSVAGPLGSIKLTDPAVFNSGYSASVQLALENFSLFEYSRYGTSLTLELARRVSKGFSYTVFAGLSANTVSTDVLTDVEIGPDSYVFGTIGASLMLDYRDSPVLPKKGWFLSARLETTSGTASFIRTDLRGAFYQPITKKFRFAAGGGLLSIQGASTEELPIDSRVFNGGPNTVRAFAERELGPVTPGDTPLGGTAAVFASAEFSYEIYPNLEFAVFTDVGSLAGANNGSPFDYSSDFRTTVGAGLRYKLPFGPIRLDYGHNLDRRTGEKSGMLHITVGFAF